MILHDPPISMPPMSIPPIPLIPPMELESVLELIAPVDVAVMVMESMPVMAMPVFMSMLCGQLCGG